MLIPILMALWLLFVSQAWSACTGSSPTWSSTPDYTSVNSCVSGATRGDTINVTAGDGTETWTSALTLTKGVSLIGPGYTNLTIDRSEMLLSIEPDATAIANEEIITVSGFTFSGNDASPAIALIYVQGAGIAGTKPYRSLVFKNNAIKNVGNTGTAIWINSQVRGVIANNLFDRVNIVLRPFGANSRAEWENSAYSTHTFGSIDNLYFEDNTIQWSTAVTGTPSAPGWIESGQSGRHVVRYNTWDFANSYQDTFPASAIFSDTLDQHGGQGFIGSPSWPDTDVGGQAGTMITEIYGNTFSNVNHDRWTAYRGGIGLFFNNIATGNAIGSLQAIQYDRGCDTYVKNTWPPPTMEINTLYGWNNTDQGVEVPFTIPAGDGFNYAAASYNNTCPPTENTDLWNLNTTSCTASACTAGIGRGTTAPTGTCTTGTAYWVASTATPTVSSSVVQNGHLYKCTATDTWTLYYTPYTYPHPLRNLVVGGGSGLRGSKGLGFF